MIHGVGADILDKRRLEPLAKDYDDPFFRKTFTEAERAAAAARRDPLMFYTERFCAKESVFKALRVSADAARLNEIEILGDELGRPCVRLYGRTAELADSLGIIRISVSLSYDGDYALTFAVCEV